MATIKTAISIQEGLFEKVEEMARELQVSRSHIFVLAVEDFISRQENRRLLKSINDAYSEDQDTDEQDRLRRMRASQRKIVTGE